MIQKLERSVGGQMRTNHFNFETKPVIVSPHDLFSVQAIFTNNYRIFGDTIIFQQLIQIIVATIYWYESPRTYPKGVLFSKGHPAGKKGHCLLLPWKKGINFYFSHGLKWKGTPRQKKGSLMTTKCGSYYRIPDVAALCHERCGSYNMPHVTAMYKIAP